MKKLFSAALLSLVITISCTKNAVFIPAGDVESPIIQVRQPVNVPNLMPGDYLNIKAIITDNKQVKEVAWEAMNAANACGNSPYKGSFSPLESFYELDIQFLVPPNFAGNRFIRLIALDHSGNLSTVDINFVAGN